MYSKVGSAAGTGGTTLAYTGLDVLYWVVAASVLIFAGIALTKLLPRRRA